MFDFVLRVGAESWNILLDSSIFVLFGIVLAGMLKVFLNPDVVVNHLGKGKYLSVIKAAFFGVPLPL